VERITLQRLAEVTGLSRATVSRALRNHPAIAQTTVNKVQAVAKKMGYHPDARISELMFHLRRSKSNQDRPVIAMIIQQSKPHHLRYDFENKENALVGALNRAESQGYRLEPFFVEPGEDTQIPLSRILWSRGINGILIAPLEQPHLPIKLQWHRFCLAAIGYSLQHPPLNRAASHHYQTFTETTKQLLQLGYTKLGCAITHSNSQRTNYIYHGAFHSMREKYGPKLFTPSCTFDSNKPDAFLHWLHRYKPDAIIGIGAHYHMIQPWLQKEGIRCPDDIGYATVHLQHFDGTVSGVKQNSTQVGAAAVDLLVNSLRYNERGIPEIAHTTLIDGTWAKGATTRRLRQISV
jgi:LacI family transcriptional regulator